MTHTLFTKVLVILGAVTFCIVNDGGSATADELEVSFIAQTPQDILSVTHSGQFGSHTIFPAGIQMMSEPGIAGGFAMTLKMRDTSGNVIGFASQLETTKTDEKGKLIEEPWLTEWTIVIPGRGTIFLAETEAPAKVLKMIQEAAAADGTWEGEIEERTTVGGGKDGRGTVIGGTGEFAGCSGSFIEINRFTGYSVQGLALVGEIEVRIKLN